MTQQEDIASQEPGARQPGAGSGQPDHGPGVPGSDSQAPAAADYPPAADAAQPTAPPEPVWPSPYLSEGAAIPEAYPAPPQPGQPRYGEPGAASPAGQPLSPGRQGYQTPGYGPPGNGQPGYQPGYGQPGSGQSRQFPRRPTGRPGPAGQVTGRDPALAATWERLLAMTVDWLLILTAAFLALLSPMLRLSHQLNAAYASAETGDQTPVDKLLHSPATASTLLHFWLIVFAIALVYFWALPATSGATVGKHVLGLRVVAAGDRSPISVKAAGVRAVAFLAGPAITVFVPYFYPLGGLIWIADGTVMLLDSSRQCLHDRAANTTVIRKRWLDQQSRPPQASPW